MDQCHAYKTGNIEKTRRGARESKCVAQQRESPGGQTWNFRHFANSYSEGVLHRQHAIVFSKRKTEVLTVSSRSLREMVAMVKALEMSQRVDCM